MVIIPKTTATRIDAAVALMVSSVLSTPKMPRTTPTVAIAITNVRNAGLAIRHLVEACRRLTDVRGSRSILSLMLTSYGTPLRHSRVRRQQCACFRNGIFTERAMQSPAVDTDYCPAGHGVAAAWAANSSLMSLALVAALTTTRLRQPCSSGTAR